MGTSPRVPCLRIFLVSVFVLSIISSRSAAAEDERGPVQSTSVDLPLSCLLRLRADPRNSCLPEEDDLLPDRLAELAEGPETPMEFQDAVKRNDLSSVSAARMADVPLPILLLLPLHHLSSCDPRALGAIVRKYPENTAIARKVLAALDSQDNPRRVAFIRQLGTNSALSFPVQAVIGEAAVRWWQPELEAAQAASGDSEVDFADELSRAGRPLLAALPPGFLADLLRRQLAEHLLTKLRTYHWRDQNDWCFQPFATRRVWMEIFKADAENGNAQLISPKSEGLNMLWAGATPDEIADLRFDQEDKQSLIKLRELTKLQVRSMLQKVFPSGTLASTDLNAVSHWVQDLSPASLQRFSVNITDFSLFASSPWKGSSLPTLKQALQAVVASDLAQGRIGNARNAGTWGRNIKDIGRLVYLIQATHLTNYSLNRLPVDVLAALDSYDLSAMQARYLTKKGEFVDLRMPLTDLQKFHGLTRAVPTGRLVELRETVVQPGVLFHLLEALPDVHPARSACLFNKVRAKMNEEQVMKAMLGNPNPSQYFNLVSSRELASWSTWMEKAFGSLKSRASPATFGDLVDKLRYVPDISLAAILGSARRELSSKLNLMSRLPWTTTSLLSSSRPLIRGALAGMTCVDVLGTELVDLPAIALAYNQRRRESGLAFPKRLQHCMQRSMEDYLEMKQHINHIFPEEGLVSLLEPSDIDAFGGYVLATLSPEHIREAKHAQLILSTIGSLPPHELLAAVPKLERLSELAVLQVDSFRARRSVTTRALFSLGSLHMFLPVEVISAVEPSAWKLFVESSAGSPRSLTVCANEEQRDAWHGLTVAAFGAADKWSAGVVGALGDLLGALPASALQEIRVSAWRDAADTLAQRTTYHLPVEAPDRDDTRPLIKACESLLPESERLPYTIGVRRLLRYYLRASQDLLDTVVPAEQLVRRLQQRSSRSEYDPIDYSRVHVSPPASVPPPDLPPPPPTTTTTEPFTTTTGPMTTANMATIVTTTPIASNSYVDWDHLFFTDEPWITSTNMATIVTTTPIASNSYVDWDDFFMTDAPWITVTVAPRTAVAPQPNTVIVHDDKQTTWPISTSTEASTTTAAGEKTSPATTEVMKPFSVAVSELGLDSALTRTDPPTTSSTARTQAVDKEERSALSLPSLLLDLTDEGTADNVTDATNGTKKARRRRDLSEDDEDLARDVHLQVTCDAVRSLGGAAWLALVPSDAERMLDVQVEDCIEVFGRLPLDSRLINALWSKIPQANRIDILGDLGGLVSAMTVEDVGDLDLSLEKERCLDLLSVIGEHVKDPSVVRAVAARFAEQNPSPGVQNSVDPDSVLLALGPAVACALPLDQLRTLLARRGSLMHAAHHVNLHHGRCDAPCLAEMARAAVTQAALGPTSNWTAEDVRDMGVIVAGLNAEQLEQLKRPLHAFSLEQPLSGLTAAAVRCMTPEQLKVVGDQLSVITPVAAAAVSEEQRHALNAGQEVVLLRVRNLAFTHVLGRRRPGLRENPGAGRSSTTQGSPFFVVLLFATSMLVRSL